MDWWLMLAGGERPGGQPQFAVGPQGEMLLNGKVVGWDNLPDVHLTQIDIARQLAESGDLRGAIAILQGLQV